MVVGARGARYNKCHSEEVALCLFTTALLLPLDDKNSVKVVTEYFFFIIVECLGHIMHDL